jgi:hypothetical protein
MHAEQATDGATLDVILGGLLARYRAHVPEVGRIVRAMIAAGIVGDEPDIENDHIAFRTLGVPHLGIASLEKIFLRHGYERRDRYEFPQKKVGAFWYSPPAPRYPRIFISQLQVSELSERANRIIHSYTDGVVADPVDDVDVDDGPAVVEFLHRPLWRTPTWDDYQALAAESEFAGWVIYNRYYLNHFTIAVHNLPEPYNQLARFNAFLESQGLTLNDAGGTIKTSADGKLLQSSTVAALVDAEFDDGAGRRESHRIAGSYVEFAERRVLDAFEGVDPAKAQRHQRREGFEAASADKIFESTFEEQTRKRLKAKG